MTYLYKASRGSLPLCTCCEPFQAFQNFTSIAADAEFQPGVAECGRTAWQKFSNSIVIVIVHSRFSRDPTLENLYLVYQSVAASHDPAEE